MVWLSLRYWAGLVGLTLTLPVCKAGVSGPVSHDTGLLSLGVGGSGVSMCVPSPPPPPCWCPVLLFLVGGGDRMGLGLVALRVRCRPHAFSSSTP